MHIFIKNYALMRNNVYRLVLTSLTTQVVYIVGSRGVSQLGGSFLGIPLGYKAN